MQLLRVAKKALENAANKYWRKIAKEKNSWSEVSKCTDF